MTSLLRHPPSHTTCRQTAGPRSAGPRAASPLIAALALAFAVPAAAQMMIRRTVGPASGGVVIHELGVVAAPDETDPSKLSLVAVFPDVERELPLKEGDQIVMIEGKRVRDVKALQEAYDGAAIGATVKLGIRRGDQRFLTSFERAEPQQGGGGPRMMIVGGPGSEADDIVLVHEFHAVLAERDGGLVVAMLPIDSGTLREDDRVVTVNGQDVTTLDAFREIYDALAIGDRISVAVRRGDEKFEFGQPKSVAPAGMIRRRVGSGAE